MIKLNNILYLIKYILDYIFARFKINNKQKVNNKLVTKNNYVFIASHT